MNELQEILVSGLPLLVTHDGYRQAMLTQFPMPGCRFTANQKGYRQLQTDHLTTSLPHLMAAVGTGRPGLSTDYGSEQLPSGSVAYHLVQGFITSDSKYWFSSKQLAADLAAAEQNPLIGAHLLHVNSPGGEAWFLDQLDRAFDECRKPIIGLAEKQACSAAYHILCHAQRVYCRTHNDLTGSIGTMTSFYDFEPYYEKLGIKRIEVKATGSDLKNKVFDDLLDGHPDDYRKRMLDPLNEQLLHVVRTHRAALAEVSAEAPVMRGEVFYTEEARQTGLVDGLRTLDDTATEALQLSAQWLRQEQERKRVYSGLQG